MRLRCYAFLCAKDDAAGQAIANRFEAQTTGLAQAQRNASDGISVAQTAEGALDQINDNVQRVRELTVQAENGTNSENDLNSIQDEITERLSEINRVSQQTDFNGTKVLDEGVSGLDIQVGANDNEQITIELEQVNAKTLGMEGFNVNGEGKVDNEAASADDLTLNGFSKTGNAQSNGSVEYTNTETTQNDRMNAADLMGNLDDGATVDLTGSTGSNTGFVAQGGGGDIAFDSVGDLEYSADNDNFTYDVGSEVDQASSADAIVPGAGEGPSKATVEIGGKSTTVMIQESGQLQNESGEDLYIDASGNLTATQAGSVEDGTVENLTTAMSDNGAVGANVSANDDLGSATLTMSDSGTKFEGASGDGTTAGIEVTGVVADKANVSSMLAADGGDVTLADNIKAEDDSGSEENIKSFTVDGNGEVEVNGSSAGGQLDDTNILYTDGDGNFTEATETTETTTYYAQESSEGVEGEGIVTDNTGAQIFKDGDDQLTPESVTESDRTEDPLAKLDDALGNIDKMRSNLGAIQNRFESAITNLSTNETNLSDAQSRIEDADYASEVAAMTKNQILQQAGTSVLAQANQLPQNALSLLG
ncbi:flagellin N-terminal helical domain-containing protein [Vreelandella jeotgali]|uniref:flagellin N-terminal helical domain-containing protein n=1 Tax=Vreelandella jeotgali TaxID=553386 RepID=UPI00034B8ADA|nr:flagellin [Halomonas jeotgali]